MKKVMLIFIMFFYFVLNVSAKDELVINNISSNNALISPKFDKYNNYYSVTIDKDIEKINFELDYNKENFDIKIVNNEELVKNKLIYVSIYDKETYEQNTYIFKVGIDKSDELVLKTVNDDKKELENKKNTDYAPIVGTICFSLIIIVFKIMFL